ncbi:amphi-Trp domain-containing protein [Maridesulfovibrio bastinii]|uniref:amphi-Trp domain-containing protein n=1 Tax=Maridesulfovibrio bastinii TaxID=47157 RepID=UPI000429962A|nr:amphi-Trp domain-containing protein [Maridesulfovibrio bastinii]
MATEEKFNFDSLQDSQSIGRFLESLIEGFHKGKISLSTDGEEIDLIPCGLLNFTVKAKKKDDSSKLSIKISWKETNQNGKSTDQTISIS